MIEYSTKDNNEIIADDLLLDVLREEDEEPGSISVEEWLAITSNGICKALELSPEVRKRLKATEDEILHFKFVSASTKPIRFFRRCSTTLKIFPVCGRPIMSADSTNEPYFHFPSHRAQLSFGCSKPSGRS
jgi:hypothetical protein